MGAAGIADTDVLTKIDGFLGDANDRQIADGLEKLAFGIGQKIRIVVIEIVGGVVDDG